MLWTQYTHKAAGLVEEAWADGGRGVGGGGGVGLQREP